ncbi:Trm112 family protein [Bordetella pertussis]|uniref:Trm112 family protein n=1 Tax=Bordetella pertussis TaxID=520 RepID=UPI0005E12204|nr:Uncharacterised protein [Bordetella pertussis]
MPPARLAAAAGIGNPAEFQRAQAELVCNADRLAFPVRDGVPIMLEAEARSLDAEAPAQPS